MKGFSPRNLKYMLKFALTYPSLEIMQQAIAQIPWGHNLTIMEKINDQEERVMVLEHQPIYYILLNKK